MTVQYFIYCDGKNCPGEGVCYGEGLLTTATSKEQRKMYKNDGWAFIRGKDYCLDCVGEIISEARPRHSGKS